MMKLTRYRPSEIISIRFYCRTCKRFVPSVALKGRDWRCTVCGKPTEPEATIRSESAREEPFKHTKFCSGTTYIPDVPIDEDGNLIDSREVAA